MDGNDFYSTNSEELNLSPDQHTNEGQFEKSGLPERIISSPVAGKSLQQTNTPVDRSERKRAKRTKAVDEAKHSIQDLQSTVGHFGQLEESKEVDMPAWQALSLSDSLLRGLFELDFLRPTMIQSLTIPLIASGVDVIGKAATGSGKTLAFGIPIIEQILTCSTLSKGFSALVLVPTRELAQQIAEHLSKVGKFAGISVITITGGLSVDKQLRQLRHNPDIIVGTPGRLWDILSTRDGLLQEFTKIQYLVLDEADRMLQAGHFQEVTKLIEKLGDPKSRQTLVFSATFQKELQMKLSTGKAGFDHDILSNEQSLALLLQKLSFRNAPRFIDANPESQVAQAVRQCLIESSPLEKDYFLYYLLLRYPARTLVFTNSIADVHRLVQLLNMLGIVAHGLHSNKQQKARLKSVERFKAETPSVLVASDVASRGLDIPFVDTVVHYHLPRSSDLYIHRSGRTARAHNSGLSILICSPSEITTFRKMQKTIQNESLVDFGVETDHLGAIKPRVNLARKILKLEEEKRKLKHGGDSWLAEAAEDLGISLSDDEGDSEAKRLTLEIQYLRKELSKELTRHIRSGFSGRYLTKGGADLIERLISGKGHEHFLGEKVQKALETL